MNRTRGRSSLLILSRVVGAAAASGIVLVACSSDSSSSAGGTPEQDASTVVDSASPSADAGTADTGALDGEAPDATFTETALTIEMTLGVKTVDAGASDAADAGPSQVATLTITARDGTTPVITDLWLYTLDGAQKTPLVGFTSTASRKAPRLILPATIAGQPSGLKPADDGVLNGLMTNTTRGSLVQGAFVSSVNGTVVVTLPSFPTLPILVIAGVEDQRYAGAAVINVDGTAGTVPAGLGTPETHTRVSFKKDIVPILLANCASCHKPTGPDNAGFYLVNGTRDDLVNDNFALKEGTLKCQTANPDGGTALAACIQAITSAEFLVEPGAPAVSDLLERSRPDEDGGTSALGLAWYGSKGARYNVTYGDRRMPSTTQSLDAGDWNNAPTAFDMMPAQFQVLFDWVAQGAPE